MTIKSITSNQRKQVLRFMEDGLDALTLDKDGAQRIIEQGDDMQAKLKEVLCKLSGGRYADEEVESNYVYPSGYSPKTLEEQISILRNYWPKLKPGKQIIQLEKKPLVAGAEALFAIVRWQALTKTYNDGLEKEILPAIKSQRKGKLCNWREGKLDPQYLRQHERTIQMLEKISNQQKSDILVVPAQFGMRHRGKSVRRAREVFTVNEFGLGSSAVGCMLLAHLERLVSYDDLWIDCPGDEYSPRADGRFDRAPCFLFLAGRVEFDTYWSDRAHAYCGSVSAFLL